MSHLNVDVLQESLLKMGWEATEMVGYPLPRKVDDAAATFMDAAGSQSGLQPHGPQMSKWAPGLLEKYLQKTFSYGAR